MKYIRYILCILLILVVIGLMAYQEFVTHDLDSFNMVRGALIILAAVSTMLKKTTGEKIANKKAFYQKAFPEFIQEPFAQDPKLEKKFYEAVHMFSQGKPASAVSALEKLRMECTSTAELWPVTVFTAMALSGVGHYQNALEKFDAARKIRDYSSLASKMGLCCHRLGRTGEAAKYYEEAIAMDSSNAVAYNNLSALQFSMGDYENALASAQDALEINGQLPQALGTAAICAKLLGDEEEYDHYYRRAVAAGYDGKKIKNALRQLNSKL